MLPKPTGTRGSSRQPSKLLIVTVALGFCSGLLTGFIYYSHQQVAPSSTGLPGGDRLHGGGASSFRGLQVERTSHGFLQVRHQELVATPEEQPTKQVAPNKAVAASPPPRSPPPPPAVERPATVKLDMGAVRKAHAKGDTIHTLMTGNGSPYQNIQARIMYATYKLVQKMPGGEKLTGFTRILHRQTLDDCADEFPTFRADPLEPLCDTWCKFPVKDRANAVMQWLRAAAKDPSMIKGAWLLITESDYVWMKPLKAPGSAWDHSVHGLAFEFDYINPNYPGVKSALAEMCPTCDLSKVPSSGPAPVLLRPQELAAAAPDWEVWSAWIESHESAQKRLGWVREMYAWCLAVARNNITLTTLRTPDSSLISQPPHDSSRGEACMYHYTWGPIYKDGAKEIWKFDKRVYTAKEDELKVPKMVLPPPWRDGLRMQDGLPVTKQLDETMVDMLSQMNRGIETLKEIKPKT